MKTLYDIAEAYAISMGYDLTRLAGKREGDEYFHFMRKEDIGHKLGLPHIIKIEKSGKIIKVRDLKEIMWASAQIK